MPVKKFAKYSSETVNLIFENLLKGKSNVDLAKELKLNRESTYWYTMIFKGKEPLSISLANKLFPKVRKQLEEHFKELKLADSVMKGELKPSLIEETNLLIRRLRERRNELVVRQRELTESLKKTEAYTGMLNDWLNDLGVND